MNSDGQAQARVDDSEERPRSFFSRLFHKNEHKTPPQNVTTLPNAASHAHPLGLHAIRSVNVSDIAIPKADIVALPVDADFDQFLEVFREHSFSRIPVFRETLDDPLGLVHIKDIFMTYGVDLDKSKFSLEPFIRPLIYVPPSMSLLTLLQKIQTEHVHMALVIDEYGGVDGLITIEDILEEIVGDITDEHDDVDEALWLKEKADVYLVDARAEIQDFESDTHVKLPVPENDEDVDTIGGLIMTYTGRVPVKDEVVRLDESCEFEIVDADPRRIKKVRLYTAPKVEKTDIDKKGAA